jgi:hypothetical protein
MSSTQGEEVSEKECIVISVSQDKTNPAPAALRRLVVQEGRIFISPLWAGGEDVVMMCAMFDGVSLLQVDGYNYLPLDWMEKEYKKPAYRQTFTKIREIVETELAKTPAVEPQVNNDHH